jgi:DNA-binding transcriptional LysR family regulator
VVPSTHRLAARASITLRELANDAFIFYPRTVGMGLYTTLVEACRRASFTPAIALEAPQLTSVISFVAAGMGVSVVPAAMSQLQAEGVRYISLGRTPPMAQLAMAYRPRNDSATLARALEMAKHESAAYKVHKKRELRP